MLRPAYLKSESGCSDPPSAQSNAAEKSVGYTNIERGITLLLLAKQNGEGTPSTTWVQKPADLGIFACLRASERCIMELEGVVHNGVIVPDDATALAEGTPVRITPAPLEKPRPFGERFAQFKGGRPRIPRGLGRAT